jgi:hypothetical protein
LRNSGTAALASSPIWPNDLAASTPLRWFENGGTDHLFAAAVDDDAVFSHSAIGSLLRSPKAHKEVVAFRRGERVYFFTAYFAAGDTQAQ